ncbi:MAG: hypothetical protein EPO07_04195 [Verrucomicrobia bacterium]|nr:MAG: hypothetical protein EPO07_04195 [Verrucomicrobiota bacterium]
MKRLFNISIIGLAAALAAGCVVTSVYPFYTAKDVVFDGALIGVWAEAGSTNAASENWFFEKSGTNAYKLTVNEKDKHTAYDAHLFKLKGKLFLDAFPQERTGDFVPPHYLLKVTRVEPQFEYALMNYEWLGKLLDKDPKAVRHVVVPDASGDASKARIVLTADTAELQKFILKHENVEGVFDELKAMKKQ